MVETVNEQPKECGIERAALAEPHGCIKILKMHRASDQHVNNLL